LVTHGVSGHELNLVSQEDNERILAELFRLTRFRKFDGRATPFVRAEYGVAEASCQIFSNTALVTMTISPRDMEDIPLETGIAFRKELNAHNCLSKPAFMEPEVIADLVGAAQGAVKQAAKARRREFGVGFAQRRLVDWKLMDGLGPAGVAACATEVDGNVAVYVSFDGNNMAPGFRERMLMRLKNELNVGGGEILTTDTHIVNGVARARMGYRLVGDVQPDKLLGIAVEVVKEAIANMSPARVGAATGTVKVRTLGETSFREVTRLIHDISRITALTLFPTAVLVTFAALLILL
jgi:putative membrane protein